MGLVKTRRLAAMYKQQRAKVAMKPSMNGGGRKACSRQISMMAFVKRERRNRGR